MSVLAARIAIGIQRQQRSLDGARDSSARAAGGRVAAGADGADGRGGIPAADRLRQHGQPAAGAAVEPAARDGRARGAGCEPLGSGAADRGGELDPLGRGWRARTRGRVWRAAIDREPSGSTTATHRGDAARWRRAAVHERHLNRRCARVWIAAGTARIETGSARQHAGVIGIDREPVRAATLERTRGDRSRARAGAARGRGTDDAQLHQAAAGEPRLRLVEPHRRARAVAVHEVSSGRRSCASTKT